jgi:hypothetical protein
MNDKTYTIVKEVLDEIDVYGLLEHGAPEDEFETEAKEVAKQITSDSSVVDIAKIISKILNKNFGLETEYKSFMQEANGIYNQIK